MQKDLQKNRFFNRYLSLSVPVMIQQLQAHLFNIFDTIMIGTVSANAISGVTVANKVYFIYSLALFGLTNGVGIFMTQYFGAKDRVHTVRVFRFGLMSCALCGIATTGILFLYPNWFIRIFVKNPETIALGVTYLRIVRFSYLPVALTMMCSVFMRVTGRQKIPTQIGFIAVITNVILNYVLIYGHLGFPAMGVAGAAYATAISRILEMGLALYAVCAKSAYSLMGQGIGFLSLEKQLFIMKKALPLIVNESVWAFANNIIFLNYCFVNEYFVPSLTAVDNISSLIYVVFSGSAAATGIIVGGALGAGDLDKAKQYAKQMIKIGIGIYGTGSVLVMLTSGLTPRLFSLENDLLKMATILLCIRSVANFVKGYTESIYYILRSGGDTKGVLLVDGIFILLGPLLVSLLFSRVIQLELLFLFAIVEGINLLKVIVSTWLYKKGRWLSTLST